jgi:hypothetical protein
VVDMPIVWFSHFQIGSPLAPSTAITPPDGVSR